MIDLDEDRGPELAAVNGLFIGLAWFFVLLRLYVKTFITKKWMADDYVIIVALLFFSTYASCSLGGVHYGTGQHVTPKNISHIPKAMYYWWLCELFYTLATVFVRLSIAIFLLRIAVKPIHRKIIYGTLAGVIVFSISYFCLVIFQCDPVSFFWRQYETNTHGHCINPAVVPNMSIAHSCVSATADWILGLLPIAVMYDLQMNTRTKVSVVGILSLGLLAGVATMIRVPYIKTLALTDDFLFATTDVAIWSTIEPGLGLVAVGAVTLRPLFRTFYFLSTRNTFSKDVTELTVSSKQTRLSKLRNSLLCPHRGEELKSLDTMQGRSSFSEGSDEHFEVGLDGKVRRKDAATVTTNPFTDEKQAVQTNDQADKGSFGGIQVLRTVDISRGDEQSALSAGSEPSSPWPLRGMPEKDLV